MSEGRSEERDGAFAPYEPDPVHGGSKTHHTHSVGVIALTTKRASSTTPTHTHKV